MVIIRPGTTRCVLLLAATVASSQVSYAQDALEEIIVTAQKREQSLTDLPLSVTAFSAEQLVDINIADIDELAENTPGLVVEETASHTPSYYIRGVGRASTFSITSSTVAVSVDEVGYSYAIFADAQVFDVNRIEVLRGPQGDLYGRNTTGGTINYVPNRPTDTFQSEVMLGYSRFDTVETEGFISGPLAEDVRARFAWRSHNRREGWQYNWVTGEEHGKTNRVSARMLLDWNPTDDLEFQFNLHGLRDKSDNTGGVTIDAGASVGAPCEPPQGVLPPPLPGRENLALDNPFRYGSRPTAWEDQCVQGHAEYLMFFVPLVGGPDLTYEEALDWLGDFSYDAKPRRDTTTAGANLRINYDFGNVLLTSITSYDKVDRYSVSQQDGSQFSDWAYAMDTDLYQFTQELRLTSTTDGPLSWIAGVYASRDKIDEIYDNDLVDFMTSAIGFPLFWNSTYVQEGETAAIFGHAEYQLTERLRLIGGARYTNEERKIYDVGLYSESNWQGAWLDGNFWSFMQRGELVTGNWLGIPTTPGELNRQLDTSKPSWKAGIDFVLTDESHVYLTVSEGWKSGGFNGENLSAPVSIGPYRPEELTSYEIGYKGAWPEANLRLGAAAYFYDYRDRQVGKTPYDPVLLGEAGGIGNQDEVEIKGGELELMWSPLDGLNIGVGFSTMRGEIIKDDVWDIERTIEVGPICDTTGQNPGSGTSNCNIRLERSGDKINRPEYQYNILLSYERDLTSNLIGRVAVNNTYQAKFDDFSESTGSYPIQARDLTRANVSVGDVDGKWNVRIWGDNIFDEEYYINVGGATTMRSARWPLPPSYGIDFTMRWQ